MGNLVVSVVLATLFAGCGANLPTSLVTERRSKVETPLAGILQATDGSTLDLSLETKPVVLMFATETCISCIGEAKKLKAHFESQGGLPKNVRLITVLAGVELDIASEWQQDLGLTWTMAVNDGLFFSRCPERRTPCVFTQNLNKVPSVHKYIGPVPISQLEEETEPWVY